jgi:outer membrane immunogenic protein
MKALFTPALTAVGLLLCAPAYAADLPSRKGPPPVYAAPPPPSWTGFYAGLNAGYGWGASNDVVTSGIGLYDPFGSHGFVANQPVGIGAAAILPPGPTPTGPIDPIALAALGGANSALNHINDSGFVGGGQIGYNFQWGNAFVIGVETDIQGAGIRGNSSSAGANVWNVFRFGTAPATASFDRGAFGATEVEKHTDWIGTVRGRVGWLPWSTVLVYGTGGLAYGGVETRVGQTLGVQNVISLGGIGSFALPWSGSGETRHSETRVGWTAGGGIEWLFLPNWSLKAEALYYDLGTSHTPNAVLAQGPSVTVRGVTASLLSATASETRVHFDGVIARVGVNYHFNWGAPSPVVAAY